MTKERAFDFLMRWRLAIALCAGSLTGGVALDLLQFAPGIASLLAAAVTAGVYLGLGARSLN